jgi:hypothetical protein
MLRVLITGMSGTGKSTLLDRLASHGYKTVDSDSHPSLQRFVPRSGDTRQANQNDLPKSADSHPTNAADGAHAAGQDGEWMWHEERVQELLSTEDAEVLFVSGTVRNRDWADRGLGCRSGGRGPGGPQPGLLTPVGLAERRRELTALHANYGRSSHADALASVDRLAARVRDLGQDHLLPTRLFQAAVLDEADLGGHLEPESIDVVMADVRYGRRTRWLANDYAQDVGPDPPGTTPVWQLLDALRPFLAADSVVAVVSDKSQRARHERYAPVGTFQIGKRRASQLTLGF